ncbi:mechanosensitive ion channel domain-containing protein [Qipengyuania vesicularis]|uniref:mechanosensitive ion channel domain-containing protein n=1 Tax=Qipengyuania vesicularis TaxID=2867232 RepID=UPI001C86D0A9|nr:mechanosensitive ion channel domain-containing protein [Qipengyuania vesicularis]MBX7528438.1 mechanosensitive ion channel [Qipengyuania vesicularis]
MKRLLAALALCAAVPAVAFLPNVPEAEAPAEPEAPVQTIDDTQDAGADERIAERISGIFAELPAFESVGVEVSEGVVTLSGQVPRQEDIARAEAIATRVSGVVTVENGLERDVSISAEGTGLASLAERWDGLVEMLPLIGLALLVWGGITLVGYLIAGLGALWHRLAPNSFLAELIASAIRFIFIIGGLVVALDLLGAGALLGAVLGGAGVIGLALGFALRETIENYLASLMLSLRQPFRANDWVKIDDLEGRVIRLTSRATVLMTLDGNHLRIPNGQVFRAVITNFTRNPQRRFQFDLGVDADDDARAARQLGRDTLAGLEFVLDDPAPEARVMEVGDSNVVIRFLAWIDQRETDWWKAQSQAIPAVKEALEEAGFGLPEPIYRLRFDPRSASIPFQQATDAGKGSEAGTPARKMVQQITVTETEEDVRPVNEIADMVDKERRESGAEQDKDLLDSSRPVE